MKPLFLESWGKQSAYKCGAKYYPQIHSHKSRLSFVNSVKLLHLTASVTEIRIWELIIYWVLNSRWSQALNSATEEPQPCFCTVLEVGRGSPVFLSPGSHNCAASMSLWTRHYGSGDIKHSPGSWNILRKLKLSFLWAKWSDSGSSSGSHSGSVYERRHPQFQDWCWPWQCPEASIQQSCFLPSHPQCG